MFFLDKVKIKIFSGKNGNKKKSFFKKNNKFIPNGGFGGKAGNVYFKLDKNLNNLNFFYNNRIFFSKNGNNGKSNFKSGRCGKSIILKLPPGVLVKNLFNNRIIFNSNNLKNKFLILKGDEDLNKNLNKKNLNLELEYSIFSHIILLGFPNTGKSTYINFISNIKSKTGNYNFTTLLPIKGILNFNLIKKISILDLPGLIQNSFNGLGVGHKFLKHLRFSKILFFFIDLFFLKKSIFFLFYFIKVLYYELFKYNKYYFYKPKIFIFNKFDLIINYFNKKKIKKILLLNNYYYYNMYISSKKKFFYKKFFYIIYKNI